MNIKQTYVKLIIYAKQFKFLMNNTEGLLADWHLLK